MAPKWVREALFLANPDLADILGDIDLDFEIFFRVAWSPNFWIYSFPDFQSQSRAGQGLGRAGLQPGRGWLITTMFLLVRLWLFCGFVDAIIICSSFSEKRLMTCPAIQLDS